MIYGISVADINSLLFGITMDVVILMTVYWMVFK